MIETCQVPCSLPHGSSIYFHSYTKRVAFWCHTLGISAFTMLPKLMMHLTMEISYVQCKQEILLKVFKDS